MVVGVHAGVYCRYSAEATGSFMTFSAAMTRDTSLFKRK